jgi:nucleoside-diphosphate-sugar epimerase
VKPIVSVAELEDRLSCPPPAVVAALEAIDGDIVVLGAGGKMGPTLARMAQRASDAVGRRHLVFAVSRFSDTRLRQSLEDAGVSTLSRDLSRREDVDQLPQAAAVIFMAGAKFGTTADAARTWATNCHVASLAAERYAGLPTVVFSTGNVYPLVPVASRGATESTPPEPIGEYAQSALGRERIFEFFARSRGTPSVIFRLNYAVELRYGVLVDIARKVWSGEPIDLAMGYVNCIWQGDANALALGCLSLVRRPPLVINVTGPETSSVRALAERFAAIFGRSAVFSGEEESTALLSDASLAYRLFGRPATELDTVIDWVADWVRAGGTTLAKPTRFEARDGRF